MSFIQRRLRLTFTLGQGDFGQAGQDTFTVEGLRTSATITRSGSILGQLELRVFGMPLDVMNKLTILGTPLIDGRNNTVQVEAGTDAGGWGVVYQGTIQEGWIDAKNMPQVAFVVTAMTNGEAIFKPVTPSSFKGTIDIGLAMSSLAAQLGLQFVNSGVEGVIADPYLHGSLRNQIEDLASCIPCNWTIDETGLHIWTLDGVRDGEIPLIAPDTGMIGYPQRTQQGFTVQSLFLPAVVFGGAIQVESDITQANGKWAIFSLIHDLEAETPGGKWMTTLECNLFGQGG